MYVHEGGASEQAYSCSRHLMLSAACMYIVRAQLEYRVEDNLVKHAEATRLQHCMVQQLNDRMNERMDGWMDVVKRTK